MKMPQKSFAEKAYSLLKLIKELGWIKYMCKIKFPLILSLAAVIAISPYIGGFIIKTKLMFTATERTAEKISNYPTYLMGFVTGEGLKYTFIFLLIAILMVLFFIYYFYKSSTVSDTYKISETGTYGTAHKMSKEESLELFNETEDTIQEILGIYPDTGLLCSKKESLIYKFNNMKLICGNPGTRKSRSQIIPDIFQAIRRGESVVVADTKGAIYNETATIAKEHGYEIRLLNFIDFKNSDSFNRIPQIGDDILKGQEYVWVVIKNIVKDVSRTDFWLDIENNLFLAVVMLFSSDQYKTNEEKSLPNIYKYITTTDVKKLAQTAKSISPNHPAYIPFSIFLSGTETMQLSAKTGLATKLQIFQSPLIQKITSNNTIDFAMPGKKKCIYYILISDQKDTFSLLSSLTFSCLFNSLVEYADSLKEQVLPIYVNIIMDEFCNLGYIDAFVRRLNTVRSRGLRITMAIQDIGQLIDVYGKNQANSILSACDYNYYLGGNDPNETAAYYNKRAGIMTIETDSSRYDGSASIEASRTQSYNKRNTYNLDEILTINPDNLLIFIKGKYPLELKKYDFSDNPLYDKKKRANFKNHIPGDPVSYSADSVQDKHVGQQMPEQTPISTQSPYIADSEVLVKPVKKKTRKKKQDSIIDNQIMLDLKSMMPQKTDYNFYEQPQQCGYLLQELDKNSYENEKGCDINNLRNALGGNNKKKSKENDISDFDDGMNRIMTMMQQNLQYQNENERKNTQTETAPAYQQNFQSDSLSYKDGSRNETIEQYESSSTVNQNEFVVDNGYIVNPFTGEIINEYDMAAADNSAEITHKNKLSDVSNNMNQSDKSFIIQPLETTEEKAINNASTNSIDENEIKKHDRPPMDL